MKENKKDSSNNNCSFKCGRYERLPYNVKRIAEGGRRISGLTKSSQHNSPLVSVITVTLNTANYISKCIESVLNQTYDNIEYLVIDGGSSDGTLDVLIKYMENIDYYLSEPDSGLYEAMNKGLSLAAGDFIIFLNSDDWYENIAIEKLIQTAVVNGADIAHADAYYVDSFGNKLHREKAWLHDGIYTRGAPMRHETMLVSKNAYEKIGGYDMSYKILSDYILMISLYDAGFKFIHIDIPLLYFRTTGISNNALATKETERARLFSSIFPFLDSDDLSVLKKHGRLDISTRLEMLKKHKGKSELFARSMAFNIADCFTYSQAQTANEKTNLQKFFKKTLVALRGVISH